MNKILFFLLLLAGTIGPVFLHAQSVKLQFKPLVGESFSLQTELEQVIEQDVMGQKQVINQNMGFDYRFDVESVDKKGNAKVKVTYLDVRLNTTTPMGNVNYDSQQAPDSIPMNLIPFAELVGRGYSYDVDPLGNVSTVYGVSELLDSILAPLTDPFMRNAMETTLRQQFSEEKIRADMEGLSAFYTEKSVKVGDEWDKTSETMTMAPVELKHHLVLKDLDKQRAILGVNTEIATRSGSKPVQLPQGEVSYDLKGTQSGELTMDIKSGWQLGSTITQNISGEVTMDNPQLPEPMKWPITIKTKITNKKL